ncbi:PKD domain-containing protein [Variovorax sp. J2P1-59]|uniref:PKD domain-containing protein n=1 Tax=Variovorax flavidus TaxID=3053501 RepID=UPI002578D6F9|nr:PKD domain-containing protein [Variovorax sp. J2P1-59]MDM0078221.1 PKD domain-containing protein [Variovorax sp. J2P1-59]
MASCPKPLFNTIAATAAALALTACGGGGSGSYAGPAPAPAAQAQSPVPPPVAQSQAPAPAPRPSTSNNTAPVSNAGNAQSTITGKPFKLDGSASSDADSDALAYQWTLATKPAASAATLASPTLAKPEFTADIPGDYVFSLIVNDGKENSAPASVTVTVALATWRDADCSADGTKLPVCTMDFSDNNASVAFDPAANALVLETRASASPATQKSYHTGITGNRAILGTGILHGVKLSEFAGFSFKSKDDGRGATTGAGLPYVTYSISKKCDGTGWANLITNLSDMSPTGPDADGYYTYTASIAASSTAWKSTDYYNPILGPVNSTVVLGPNKDPIGGSLQALIQAYPDACIYNWPNPDAQVPGATNTPAVMLMLGSSGNLAAKKAWFKDIRIGDKVVF